MMNFQQRKVALTESACPIKAQMAVNTVRKGTPIHAVSAEKVLVLRTCKAIKSRNYPRKILATDGAEGMLHGWLFGEGECRNAEVILRSDTRFQVVEVEVSGLMIQEGQVSFSHGVVLHTGDRLTATKYLEQHEPRSRKAAVIGACRHVGNRRRVCVGAAGMATTGNHGTATAGNFGVAVAGDRGRALTGECGTASVGDRGYAYASDFGTAIAGEWGIASAGCGGEARALTYGTASAGIMGNAIAGDHGNANAGIRGTATAGLYGTVSAGPGGEIRLRYLDAQSNRYRTVTGYIGENNLTPFTSYTLDANHQFVPVSALEVASK